jgi:hypothetical protein
VFIKLTPAVIGNVVGPAESKKDILDFVIFIVDIVAPALAAIAVVLAAVLMFCCVSQIFKTSVINLNIF